MKVFFTTFFCILFLFVCAQQKTPPKKEVKNKSKESKKVEARKNAFISSRVIDEKGNPLSFVQVEITDDSTGEVIAISKSESSGLSRVSVPPGKKYDIVFSKPSYFFQLANAVIPDTLGYEIDLKDITLKKLEVGKKIVLNDISFELNQFTLRKESFLELECIVKLLTVNASLQLEISGHTDNVGSMLYNRQFSEQRAKGVMDNLISKGCEKSHLTYKGYGASQPISTTEKGREQNRRIEIKVLKMDEHSLVQHEYIYHSALKKEESIDTSEIVELPEKKDTVLPIAIEIKKAKNIDSTNVETIQENKDTTKVTVKNEEPHQESKDTALTIVKLGENTDSTAVKHIQENKDTTLTIVSLGENIDSTKVKPVLENRDTTATVTKQIENIDSTNIAHLLENKDTTVPVAIEIKKGESIDTTSAKNIQENKDTVITAVKTEVTQPVIIHSLKLDIKNMGQQINSPYADYAPLLSLDGHTMLFTSRRPSTKKEIQKGKEGLEKVYVTYYDDKNEKWLEPKLLGPSINLQGMNNSAVALSNDGQHMLMYHEGTDLNANGDIFESQLYIDEWTDPVKLPPHINSEDNETSANLSPDGRTIYFISDRKGGLGGKDIWYSSQDENGKWGEAVNMGESINTPEDEESVFIHPNGNVIFFSSKGHNSLGGYDVFMSVYDEITKKWAQAENLGAPINTPEDDISFVMEANGKTGHYASSKPGGLGGLDIYGITFFEDIMKKNIALLQGRITNKNGKPVGSTITIKNRTTGKLNEPIKSNKNTGQYFVSLPPGKKYEIIVTAYGYNTYTESLDIPYKAISEEIIKDIVLESKNAFISSRVMDEKGNPISKVLIEIVDKATNQVIAKPTSNSAGYFLVSVPFGKTYDVVFSKSGYLFQSVNAVVPDSVGYEKELKDITLQKVEVGKKIVLNSIFFDLNHPTLRKESILEIERVVKLMNEMTSLQVEISGHTDNVGSLGYKKQLSEERAKAVVGDLVVKGLNKERMKYVGYGPTQPIAINFSEEGRKLNDRIELKVLKVDLVAEQLAESKRLKESANTEEKTEEEQREAIIEGEKHGQSIDHANDSIKVTVKNVGRLINSSFSDYGPLLSEDMHTMTFTSRKPLAKKDIKKEREGLENVYVTYYDDKNEKWLEPKILGPTINLPDMHNSALALPNDGQQMLAYHCVDDITATGDIYEHLLLGKEWCIPVRALPKPINSDYNETAISISPNGKTYYFVSDRKGGFGGKDIWYATMDDDGVFRDAVNMGPSINTAADEESVFIHPYGNVIFFSSKGHNSMGGYDIFMSTFDEITETWLEPENLGLPINSYGDDVYFTLSPNGKTGYYASSKPGKIEDLDIYSIDFSEDIIKKNTTMLKGRVTNQNKRPVKAIIVLKNKTTDKIIDIIKTNELTGSYSIPLISGTKVEAVFNAYGYSAYKQVLDVRYKKGYQNMINDVVMESNSAFIASRALDENGRPMSGVQVKVIDDVSSEVIATPLSDSAGFTLNSVPFGRTYEVIFGKSGYFFQSFIVTIPDSAGYETILKDVILQKIEVGKKSVLNTVLFDSKQSALRKESNPELQQVIKLMKETVSLQLEISGHTDNSGSEKNNQILSEQRAKIVMDSLISNGCDKNRLKYKGYGSTKPIASNHTKDGRKLNNRIELTALKVDLKAEQQSEEKRKKIAPVIKENQDHSKEQKKINDKPDSESLKKPDKDRNRVVSDEELQSAIDSTRKELKKALTPVLVSGEGTEENRMKDTNAIPVNKVESNDSTNGELIPENKDKISTKTQKDKSNNSIKEEPLQEKEDTIATTDKTDLTTKQAEQEKELVELMEKDSIVTFDKAELAAKQAKQEKEKKDTIEAAHKADLSIEQSEQEKELDKLMKKDSIAAFDEAGLAAKQSVQEKESITLMQKDSVEAFDKVELAARKAEQEKEMNDSLEAAHPDEITAKQAVQEKEKKDTIVDPFTKIKNLDALNKEQSEKKKKNSVKLPIPERFKKFDKDSDGFISYDEVLRVIDNFLDEDPKKSADENMGQTISELIDFYFDQ